GARVYDGEVVHETAGRGDEVTISLLVAEDDRPVFYKVLFDGEAIVGFLIFRFGPLHHFRLVDAKRFDSSQLLKGERHPFQIAFLAALQLFGDVRIAGMDDDFGGWVAIENSFLQIFGLALLANVHRRDWVVDAHLFWGVHTLVGDDFVAGL